ncbi:MULTISPECIES: methylmalonyl-CoA epimerase [unclassified Thermosipho (in: thermotogales)]|uniref:methylmalonyl-CoA epimerase n=1 Tax=unclassified Thermosipho (in: thermotogales) TaxID=2676525 RepID=UPI00098611D7|nr:MULTISPECIES: methylmalonyl-CoA epimerase [unclassified Thermosipho (in: thermotogales)]MBT1248187.1 methylmalonyl-CoA epimerase [Thermosipho sp. 1244]OOC46446.1 lactoylglutathione lyase [Thermosipho sp. 1223]
MKTNKIDHIGIVVKNAEERLNLYKNFLGLEVTHIETIPERGLKIYFVKIGETRFELLEPINENSEVSKFLEKKGEGIHHIAVNVSGINEAISLAKEMGLKPLSEEPQKGAGGTKVLFIHPKTTGGILLELVEGNH